MIVGAPSPKRLEIGQDSGHDFSGHNLRYGSPRRRTGRCRIFPLGFKRQVVGAAFHPDASVSLIAREHVVDGNLVFLWRQQFQGGLFGSVSPSAKLLRALVIEALMDLTPVQPRKECHSKIAI
jgi:transposase